jgi:hypothetical protein
VGLAYPSLAEKGVKPMFDELMDNHLLENNVFAFYLAQYGSKLQSELTLGYYDESKFEGEITWLSVEY